MKHTCTFANWSAEYHSFDLGRCQGGWSIKRALSYQCKNMTLTLDWKTFKDSQVMHPHRLSGQIWKGSLRSLHIANIIPILIESRKHSRTEFWMLHKDAPHRSSQNPDQHFGKGGSKFQKKKFTIVSSLLLAHRVSVTAVWGSSTMTFVSIGFPLPSFYFLPRLGWTVLSHIFSRKRLFYRTGQLRVWKIPWDAFWYAYWKETPFLFHYKLMQRWATAMDNDTQEQGYTRILSSTASYALRSSVSNRSLSSHSRWSRLLWVSEGLRTKKDSRLFWLSLSVQ